LKIIYATAAGADALFYLTPWEEIPRAIKDDYWRSIEIKGINSAAKIQNAKVEWD